MEAELISMMSKLYNGDSNTCGIVTSGGTESLLLSCLAYRNMAMDNGIDYPEIVMPETAHPAINKACAYFKIKLVIIKYNHDTGKVNIKELKRAINKNTCMVIVSVPNYPNGNIDDVEEIADICYKEEVPLHVDCCLGGFLAPFAEECEISIPTFDFRLPAIKSMSTDNHKYGMAPKGVSVALFRNAKIRGYCMFSYTSWPGGIYVTPGT